MAKKKEAEVAVPERNSLHDLVTLSQEIQRKLFECGGELTPEVEEEIIKLEKKLPSKVDGYKFIGDELRNAAVAWKKRSQEMGNVGKQFEAYADKLDDIMCMAVERFGADLDGIEYYAKRQATSKPAVILNDEKLIPDGHKQTTLTVTFTKDDAFCKNLVAAIEAEARDHEYHPVPGWIKESTVTTKDSILEDLKQGLPVEGASLKQSYYVRYYPNAKGVKGGTKSKQSATPANT